MISLAFLNRLNPKHKRFSYWSPHGHSPPRIVSRRDGFAEDEPRREKSASFNGRRQPATSLALKRTESSAFHPVRPHTHPHASGAAPRRTRSFRCSRNEANSRGIWREPGKRLTPVPSRHRRDHADLSPAPSAPAFAQE